MMRGSPVWGALKITMRVPARSITRYSVKRRRRKTDSASAPFSQSTKRVWSASRPLATRPIQMRVSSPAEDSDGTRPAYRRLHLQGGDAAENQTDGTGCLGPGIDGDCRRRVAPAGNNQPCYESQDRQDWDDQQWRWRGDARQDA